MPEEHRDIPPDGQMGCAEKQLEDAWIFIFTTLLSDRIHKQALKIHVFNFFIFAERIPSGHYIPE